MNSLSTLQAARPSQARDKSTQGVIETKNQTIQQQNTPRNDRRPKNKTKVNMAHHWGKMRCPEASAIAEG